MKIYTKTGDKGTTALFGGEKISKADPRLDAYGSCDNLNSVLGWTLSEISGVDNLSDLQVILTKTQSNLFTIGSRLATADAELRKKLGHIAESDVEELETNIDKMTDELPPLKSFILPGGTEAASRLHMSRTASRSTERSIIHFFENSEEADPLIMVYINRLSDFLFVAARYANFKMGTEDVPWISGE